MFALQPPAMMSLVVMQLSCSDGGDMLVLTSAVKRFISSITGFHNHREGPNYHEGSAALRHYANQTASPL